LNQTQTKVAQARFSSNNPRAAYNITPAQVFSTAVLPSEDAYRESVTTTFSCIGNRKNASIAKQ
jgi:hypothetical protein